MNDKISSYMSQAAYYWQFAETSCVSPNAMTELHGEESGMMNALDKICDTLKLQQRRFYRLCIG